MDIMRTALKNRKKDIESKLNLKVEAGGETPETEEDREENKGSDPTKNAGLAPSVKDQAPEKKAFSEKIEPDSDEMDEMTQGMPELPVNREPNTLGEKARFGLEEKFKKSKMKGSV